MCNECPLNVCSPRCPYAPAVKPSGLCLICGGIYASGGAVTGGELYCAGCADAMPPRQPLLLPGAEALP